MAQPTLTGTLLRERRQGAGLRQAEVARRAAISPAYLNLLEHNRRNATPEVLGRLAAALGVPIAALGGGTAAAVADGLRGAAAQFPDAGAEAAKAEDLLARFPGWAALIQALSGRVAVLEPAVAALNDRLSQDPHLSSALHEVLSALSGVQAAASILAETEDLEPAWRTRFRANLREDAARVADGAEALVAYLDRAAAPLDGLAAPQDEVEAWLAGQNWQIAADAAAREEGIAGLASATARALARAIVDEALADLTALPDATLAAALAQTGNDGFAVAGLLPGVPPTVLLRRLALWPGSPAGLVLCDGSGTMTFRKPAEGFVPPRFGAACPLWPLYDALARPGAWVEARVETAGPQPRVFRTLSAALTRWPAGPGGPELRQAAMLVLPETPSSRTGPFRPIGPTCRICPRAECPARREPSILG
jgi:transcriptional regulator with XRE-family HTH domain